MPEQPKTFRVTRTRRTPSPNPKRKGKWDRIVIYELDTGEHDSVIVPDEDFSDATVLAAVKADVQEQGSWQKKEFRL